MANSITLDSFGPLPVERPASVADLCALVTHARAAKHGLYPVGGRTTLDIGLPPTKPGVVCDTTALSGVIDYPARDMTITARAGTTVAALQAELGREGQWLPVDVAAPERATLGGAVAVNASGPRRFGYGTLRDYVIGISFVSDDGVEVKAGGRVVKNVAGYDLMKLQIGALGTLGVVTQLTFKVKPKPDASAAVIFGCDSASLSAVLDRLAASKTRPVAVELLNSAAWREARVTVPTTAQWRIVVGFEEKTAAVRWQVAMLIDELKAVAVGDAIELPDMSIFDTLTALQLRAESRFIGKLSVLPSNLADAVVKLPSESLVHAHALSGVAWVHGAETLPEGTTVRRCPTERKKSLPDGGQEPSSWELMRHVKRTLDPDNVFNPGRLFGDV
ncbi:FAD-binding oxidoreductase [Gemmata sp. G18]|uniref:FAD-binding oxidoreductase n=1 Tax=Gemmata palustris TaxID=2822762 RepID=A0ABS5BKW1_9BACT|nr:FAD-binding oxidoreductase [Gemmata palustris]MBP3954347.1 FAD-binding oxidoreductase [Gemmata palustris]